MGLSVNKDKVIALAGVCQAACVVTQIAEGRTVDEPALAACVRSVLNLDEAQVSKIYGGVDQLILGLEGLGQLMSGASGLAAQSRIRYMMSMDQLASRLAAETHTQALVGQGIEEINLSHGDVSPDAASISDDPDQYDDVLEQLSLLYQKTLSLLPPRIIVNGAEGTLSDADNVAKLRSALFAGVRAAYLWHQLGGRRWHLLFMRKAYGQGVKALRA